MEEGNRKSTNNTNNGSNLLIDDEDDSNVYNWEKAYERSWEAITEDERGLKASTAERKKRLV